MAEFGSWRDYETFARSVRREARYIFDERTVKFLHTVMVTSEARRRHVPSGKILWRSQHGHGWHTEGDDEFRFEVPAPFPPERMRPLPHSAREGRVNPKGIPCLYLATTKETAMAEVRPWIGSYISVGQFKILRDLELVDCSVEHAKGPIFFLSENEPSPKEREMAVWSAIDNAFSEPVTSEEDAADYVPTQVLAEAFRRHGYDGIIYKSLLGSGHSVALYDLNQWP